MLQHTHLGSSTLPPLWKHCNSHFGYVPASVMYIYSNFQGAMGPNISFHSLTVDHNKKSTCMAVAPPRQFPLPIQVAGCLSYKCSQRYKQMLQPKDTCWKRHSINTHSRSVWGGRRILTIFFFFKFLQHLLCLLPVPVGRAISFGENGAVDAIMTRCSRIWL